MIEVITSKSNEKAKFIRSLNDKKGRQKNGCFYLEGIKVVNEVIERRGAINFKFIAPFFSITSSTSGSFSS